MTDYTVGMIPAGFKKLKLLGIDPDEFERKFRENIEAECAAHNAELEEGEDPLTPPDFMVFTYNSDPTKDFNETDQLWMARGIRDENKVIIAPAKFREITPPEVGNFAQGQSLHGKKLMVPQPILDEDEIDG